VAGDGGHTAIVTPRETLICKTHLTWSGCSEGQLRSTVSSLLDLRDVTYIDMSGVRAIENAIPQGASTELIAVVSHPALSRRSFARPA
jgi:hypothetical protein